MNPLESVQEDQKVAFSEIDDLKAQLKGAIDLLLKQQDLIHHLQTKLAAVIDTLPSDQRNAYRTPRRMFTNAEIL